MRPIPTSDSCGSDGRCVYNSVPDAVLECVSNAQTSGCLSGVVTNFWCPEVCTAAGDYNAVLECDDGVCPCTNFTDQPCNVGDTHCVSFGDDEGWIAECHDGSPYVAGTPDFWVVHDCAEVCTGAGALFVECGPGSDGIDGCECCTPSCAGRECGGDGCGGTCGSCGYPEICRSGTCGPDPCRECTQSCRGLPSCCQGCGCICQSACGGSC